jgi:tetratricopeptide (TPR) repeat protein
VLPPSAAEVVESIQAGIGTVPLTALPGQDEAQPSRGRQLFRTLHHRLLQACLAVVHGLRGPGGRRANDVADGVRTLGKVVGILALFGLGLFALASFGKPGIGALLIVLVRLAIYLLNNKNGASSRAARPTASPRPGTLEKLEKWLGGTINDLEKKRQNEIERLLRLFGENPAEALKYAIPLGGPYENRGTSPTSASLGARDTRFNLSGLGGGRRTDVWDLGDYQHDLRRQYQEAARREVAAGRFQQAAYIHAHLLGDYLAAANVLEQGGSFREAAVLFKDHLRNLGGAAQCLERGGLLLEAAELFGELGQHEKAGDLHSQLGQPEVATQHYERGVSILLGNDDHATAARILADKLRATDRAQQVLLQGWNSTKQAETCLTQYFDVVAARPENDLSAHVTTVYQQHTSPEQRVPLLRVLAKLTEKRPATTLAETSRTIAYEVVSAEADAGNLAPLPLLRHFLPDDRLIAADCSRYATSLPRPSVAVPVSALTVHQLDSSIEWKSAITHRHQWVAVGIRDERLHLARGNWYGNVVYSSWTTPVRSQTALVLVADEYHSHRVFLRSSSPIALEPRTLPKNKYFPELLTVECPSWLPYWPTRVALLPDGVVATAQLRGAAIQVQRYAADGKLLSSFDHRLPATVPGDIEERAFPCELIYHQGRYYTYGSNWLIGFSEDGYSRAECLPLQAFQLVRSPYAAEFCLAVALQESFLLWNPARPKNNSPQALTGNRSATIDIRFVGPEHLVSVDMNEATLYHLLAEGASEVRTITSTSQLVAVLPTSNRQQFALLEVTGKISLHELS